MNVRSALSANQAAPDEAWQMARGLPRRLTGRTARYATRCERISLFEHRDGLEFLSEIRQSLLLARSVAGGRAAPRQRRKWRSDYARIRSRTGPTPLGLGSLLPRSSPTVDHGDEILDVVAGVVVAVPGRRRRRASWRRKATGAIQLEARMCDSCTVAVASASLNQAVLSPRNAPQSA